MDAGMFGLRCKHLYVFLGVIAFVAIYVMHHFTGAQGAPQQLLGYRAVFMPTVNFTVVGGRCV